MQLGNEIVKIKSSYMVYFKAIIFILSVGLSARGVMAASADLPDWSYSGENGPSFWAGLTIDGVHFPYETCGSGKKQSPINLQSPIKGSIDELVLEYQSWSLNIENNGHTIQVNVAPGSTMEFDDQVYYLVQFHFHAGSEHQINGQQAPLEIHFVHMNSHGELAVLGVFVKEGHDENPNEVLSKVLEYAPEEVGKKTLVENSIDARLLLPENEIESMWYYDGSLTTPPCTQGVKWFVTEKHLHATKAQLAEFEHRLHHNYRPIQLLNERELYFSH